MTTKKVTDTETNEEVIPQLTPDEIVLLQKELAKSQADLKKAKSEATKLKKASQEVGSIRPTDREAYLNEKIPFKAPLRTKEDTQLFVGVNGRRFLIQRGKTVMLPRYVVQHLANVDNQATTLIEMKVAYQKRVLSEQLK